MTGGQKRILVSAFCLLAVAATFAAVPPIPQDQAYHQFAEQRQLLGVPHFGDVVSNVAFTVIGVWGLWVLAATASGKAFAARIWALPYAVFLAGFALVGLGSAYYHWAPTDETLLWDRLPMTIAFMGLAGAVIADRLGTGLAKRALLPLLLAGVGSVIVWRFTGDLRLYGLIQFLPMAVLPLLCLLFPSQGGLHGRALILLAAFYGLAKALEYFDVAVWTATSALISGHTLKHLAAAAAGIFVVRFIATVKRA